jgi:hypothetical protein
MIRNGFGQTLLALALFTVVEFLIPNTALNIAFFAMLSLMLLGLVLVAYGTLVRNRWGINTHPINCPVCGLKLPKIRRPRSLHEMLWGGCTCEKCGCAMDKWGNRITG